MEDRAAGPLGDGIWAVRQGYLALTKAQRHQGGAAEPQLIVEWLMVSGGAAED